MQCKENPAARKQDFGVAIDSIIVELDLAVDGTKNSPVAVAPDIQFIPTVSYGRIITATKGSRLTLTRKNTATHSTSRGVECNVSKPANQAGERRSFEHSQAVRTWRCSLRSPTNTEHRQGFVAQYKPAVNRLARTIDSTFRTVENAGRTKCHSRDHTAAFWRNSLRTKPTKCFRSPILRSRHPNGWFAWRSAR